MQGINPQYIKNVPLAALPLPPLRRLHRAQIMRRVHVADLPLGQPRHLPFHVLRPVELVNVVEGGALGVVAADGGVLGAVSLLHQAFGEGDAGITVSGAGGVTGDVGGEGGRWGTLGGRGVGGDGRGGGEGAVKGH